MQPDTLPHPTAQMPEQFCDGIGEICLARGMVRIEILRPSQRSGGRDGGLEGATCLVMTPDAFLRCFEQIDQLARRAGLVRPEGEAARPIAQERRPSSPNFAVATSR